jgi:hypothetical protein
MNKLIYTNGDNFYVFKGMSYDKHFPIEWAMNPKKINDIHCGPPDCLNCLDYGSYNGVFIGYCANCAAEYDYQRGNGFIDSGIEGEEGLDEKNSVWNSYLKQVSLNEIGFLPKEEEFERFQMNGHEEDEIPWMNCEIDDSDEFEEEEEENKFEPIYHYNEEYYDEEYFEEGPSPLTMEDLMIPLTMEDCILEERRKRTKYERLCKYFVNKNK